METIIIDANNLMHKVSGLKILLKQDKDIAVDTMIAKMQDHYIKNKAKLILVFDGFGKNRHIGNIDVKFSKTSMVRGYENADELIKSLIEKAKNPKLVRVVSSDNGISWFAKDCGCKVQSSESYWGELKEKKQVKMDREADENEKPKVVTRGEYEYLLKEFKKK